MSDTDPIFVGNPGSITDSMVPQAGARLSKTTEFGFDMLTIPYRVKTALIASKMPALYSVPPAWFPAPGLFLTGYDTTAEEGLISELSLNYKGCLNNNVPSAYWENNFVAQTVNTSTDNVSVTWCYYAPSTTWRWIEKETPTDSPRYADFKTNADPISKIYFYYARNNDGTGGGILLSDYNEANSKLSRLTQITQYNPKMIVPNKYWECTCTVSRLLMGN